MGGEDEAIRAFQRPRDSGSQTTLEKLMGNTPIMEAPTEDVATGMGESFVKCRNIEIIKMPWALHLDIILQRW